MTALRAVVLTVRNIDKKPVNKYIMKAFLVLSIFVFATTSVFTNSEVINKSEYIMQSELQLYFAPNLKRAEIGCYCGDSITYTFANRCHPGNESCIPNECPPPPANCPGGG